MSRSLLNAYFLAGLFFDPEVGDGMCLRNVDRRTIRRFVAEGAAIHVYWEHNVTDQKVAGSIPHIFSFLN
jgi:hypothetical protein